MSYTRAEDAQIDNWERVGNKGWGWNDLLPYYKKSEDFQIPTKDQASLGASYTAAVHGRSGPLKVGWPKSITNGTVFSVLNETMSHLGVEYNPDVNSGHMIGFTDHPDTLDRERNIREDAARAYYWPYETRSNLKIISNTQANKIIWANNTHGEAVAVGVEVSNAYGTQNIYAKKEVILSAGSLRSPQLLELSGVGNPDILSRYNISTRVALPAVGENLQDQTNNALTWESTETLSGLATFSALVSVDQLYGKNVSAIKSQIDNDIVGYAKTLSKKTNGAVKEDHLLNVLKIQRDLIFESLVPYAEIVFAPSGQAFACEYWPLQPFSRGSVHIQSANVSQTPNIDPNYFMFGQDVDAQVDVAQYIRNLFGTAPLTEIVGDELSPTSEILPKNASSATWENWVKENCKSLNETTNLGNDETLTLHRPTQLPPRWYQQHAPKREGRSRQLRSPGLRYQECTCGRCLDCAVPDLWSLDQHSVRHCRESLGLDQGEPSPVGAMSGTGDNVSNYRR